MAKSKPVIITCAPTGGIHTPTMSEHLPITPDQIAQASIEAAEAGAAVIHLHARNPETGKPDPRPELFQEFLPKIKGACDAVINVSTGGGLGNLMHMHTIADKLFGDDYEWSVLAAGRHQMPFATQAAMLGGNLRVGMEDSLYIGPGQLTPSNAAQVTKIRGIVEALGLEIATPTEARQRLNLKGAEHVNF